MKKILLAIAALIVAGVVVLFATFDANSYRPQIAEALSEQLGRTVKLDGPIKLGLSWSDGFRLGVSNVSIANPPWASRPVMAKIGELYLGVGIQPLLSRKLEVSSFKLADADVQLETNAGGQTNWEFNGTKKEPSTPPVAPPAAGKAETKPVAIHVSKVNVSDSRFAIKGKDGKTNVFKVDDLTFDGRGKGIKLTFKGEAAGAPVTLDASGGELEKMMGEKWPFKADAVYMNYKIHAEGSLNNGAKNVVVDTYTLGAGDSKITGALKIALGGQRPAITGTVNSDKLNPSDFKQPETAAPEGKSEASPSPKSQSAREMLFSNEPLNLDGLKAADAKLDVAIGEVPIGPSSLKKIQAKVNLENGRLLVSPYSLNFAGTEAKGQKMVDASVSPVKVSAILNAPQLDMSKLAELGGLESFITGKADMTLDIESVGNSMHAIASNANGHISLIAAGGTLSQKILGDVAGSLLNAFAPGTGQLVKPALNCMVARFKIVNGMMQTDGLLLDTAQATIAGTGSINLRDETMDMVLRTRTKAVNVGGLEPPLRVSGPLTKLSYVPDIAGTAKSVVGLLTNGAVGDAGVPEVVSQAGQNACVYTIEHPQASKPAGKTGAVQDAVKKAGEKAKDMGNQLIQGIGKGLFGN